MSNLNVSIIIPAYNTDKTVAETIKSVINQTYGNWEAIIVDDCSTDQTNEIAQEFAYRDKRIRIVRHDVNKGLSNARNTGIRHSKSDWLVFLDADDLLLPDYLENMFREVDKDQNIDCIHCGWYRLGNAGEVDHYGRCDDVDKLFPVFAKKNGFSTVSVCMLTKKITESVHGFDSNYNRCADWDFWQRIARSCAVFRPIETPLVYYRMTENSLSSNIILTTIEGLSIIETAHRYDIRVPCADNEFLYGISKDKLSSAKLNWIIWPCAYLIGQGHNPDLALNLVKNCSAPDIQPEYVAGVFHATVMVAQGKGTASWRESWPVFEKQIYGYLCQLEQTSGTKDLAERAYSKLRIMIFNG